MPRFVVLEHDWPTQHLDLMVERAGVLRTWRLSHWPTVENPARAEQIADHRLDYLEYEGPVSGGRGVVRRINRGECECIDECLLIHGTMLRIADGVMSVVSPVGPVA